MANTQAELDDAIYDLELADVSAIRARWKSLYRLPFPEHLPRGLIVSIMGYRIQADLLGDLGREDLQHLATAQPAGNQAPSRDNCRTSAGQDP